MRCSLKDQLEYDALPQEIRDLVERVFGSNADREAELNRAYEEGFADGSDYAYSDEEALHVKGL